LLIFLAGSAPVVFFAVVIFEPGSPERYLPSLPFLVMATAWVLRDLFTARRISQFVVAAFLICTVLTNGYAFAAPRVLGENRASLDRVSELRTHLRPHSQIMLATNQDELQAVLNRSAFGAINRPDPIRVYDVIDPGTVRILEWKRELAERILEVWKAGGDVWVSKRLWSPRPLPAWNWVEGDDPRITWQEVPVLFATLSTDGESGGPDGFARVAQNAGNESLLTALATVRSESTPESSSRD
jgi:hypothetical protein